MHRLSSLFRALAASLAVLPLLVAGAAAEDIRVTPYGQAGYWQILAIFDAEQRFDHCMATVQYRSGARLSLNAHADGRVQMQVHDPAWPARDLPKVPASLTLSEQRLEGVAASMSGRSLFIEMTSLELALWRESRSLLVETPHEIISLGLNGAAAAVDGAEQCRAAGGVPPKQG